MVAAFTPGSGVVPTSHYLAMGYGVKCNGYSWIICKLPDFGVESRAKEETQRRLNESVKQKGNILNIM